MRPVAISGIAPAPKVWQSKERSMHALEAAAPAVLALAIAADGRLSLDTDPPDCAGDAPAATVTAIDGAEPRACVHQVVQPSRVLKWESVARLTIGKPPRAPRVDVV